MAGMTKLADKTAEQLAKMNTKDADGAAGGLPSSSSVPHPQQGQAQAASGGSPPPAAAPAAVVTAAAADGSPSGKPAEAPAAPAPPGDPFL